MRGAGVVGQQPLIDCGASHTYSSGTVMTSKVGTMQGSYQMKATDGQLFDAIIAPFRLAVPGALHRLGRPRHPGSCPRSRCATST